MELHSLIRRLKTQVVYFAHIKNNTSKNMINKAGVAKDEIRHRISNTPQPKPPHCTI